MSARTQAGKERTTTNSRLPEHLCGTRGKDGPLCGSPSCLFSLSNPPVFCFVQATKQNNPQNPSTLFTLSIVSCAFCVCSNSTNHARTTTLARARRWARGSVRRQTTILLFSRIHKSLPNPKPAESSRTSASQRRGSHGFAYTECISSNC